MADINIKTNYVTTRQAYEVEPTTSNRAPTSPSNPFQNSAFSTSSQGFSAGNSTDLSSFLSSEDKNAYDQIFSGLSDEDKAKLVDAGSALNRTIQEALMGGWDGQGTPPQSVINAITNTSSTYALIVGTSSADSAMSGVVAAGLAGIEKDLQDFAAVVQGHLDEKKSLNEDLAEARDTIKNWPEGAETQNFSWTEFDGNGNAIRHENEPLTRDQADQLVSQMDTRYQTLQDMSQMDNLRLQDMYQKQQQAYTTLSNILKMQFDLIKAIIGNIRA